MANNDQFKDDEVKVKGFRDSPTRMVLTVLFTNTSNTLQLTYYAMQNNGKEFLEQQIREFINREQANVRRQNIKERSGTKER